MEHLTNESFKEKIFDYENNKEWKFEGDKPTILSFSANWCMPCKTLTPILEELITEYDGNINIYKVDVDEEPMLSTTFGIRSVPSILFIPMDEQPQMTQGALPKNELKEIIKDVLKVE